MKKNRQPQHMGTGIYVHQQFRPGTLVKGDTFWDADYGPCVWTGQKWLQQCSRKDISWQRHISGIDSVSCIIDGKLTTIRFSGYSKREAINSFVNTYKIYFYD